MRHLTLIFLITIGFYFFPPQGMCQDIEEKLDFVLPAPKNELQKKYLGLSNDEHFSLGQIKADIVIIEIFSMYCPICQREAANVNTMYQQIENSRLLKNKVKLIGIGAGNSSYEVNFFKKKYTIKFPLFSDADFSIHKKIGAVGTPHFYGLTLQGNKKFEVFYSKSGEISDPEKFLETILKESNFKELS